MEIKKLLIGIDLSLDSPGFTFNYDGEIKHLSLVNRMLFSVSKKSNDKVMESILNLNPHISDLLKIKCLKIKFHTRYPVKSVDKKIKDKKLKFKEFSRWQRDHYLMTSDLSKYFCLSLKEFIDANYPNVKKEDTFVCIEHYSPSSKSDNLIQIVELSYPIKNFIINQICPLENFYPVPISSVKMMTGNGNALKIDMFNYFVKKDTFEYSFKKYVMDNEKNLIKHLKNKLEPLKPIDDIIDSYFIMRYLENFLNS
jgi:hypothetical protein